jgi:hypothetical protein
MGGKMILASVELKAAFEAGYWRRPRNSLSLPVCRSGRRDV